MQVSGPPSGPAGRYAAATAYRSVAWGAAPDSRESGWVHGGGRRCDGMTKKPLTPGSRRIRSMRWALPGRLPRGWQPGFPSSRRRPSVLLVASGVLGCCGLAGHGFPGARGHLLEAGTRKSTGRGASPRRRVSASSLGTHWGPCAWAIAAYDSRESIVGRGMPCMSLTPGSRVPPPTCARGVRLPGVRPGSSGVRLRLPGVMCASRGTACCGPGSAWVSPARSRTESALPRRVRP
jgi:hypothetical protein